MFLLYFIIKRLISFNDEIITINKGFSVEVTRIQKLKPSLSPLRYRLYSIVFFLCFKKVNRSLEEIIRHALQR